MASRRLLQVRWSNTLMTALVVLALFMLAEAGDLLRELYRKVTNSVLRWSSRDRPRLLQVGDLYRAGQGAHDFGWRGN